MRRKHPTRPALRWFDASEIALVAACSSAIEGDASAKREAHRDAIVGAFAVSNGPPTVLSLTVSSEQVRTDLERIFGATWNSHARR